MLPSLIQIRTWLMQPHVWRLVGFASTVVGLLCYALSSYFNHLFGDWNLLKIFLYSIFSLIICVAVLFAKVWQGSSNLRLKAHMAFLVLTITSIYSSFFDKVVNGKPDAYGLVSCAAFAMMSLSLSRQTHCGFEVDLLYFFLGALIIQLMKIKLWFGVVGVSFSYLLIILRSFLDAPTENGHVELQDQHFMAIQVDPQQPSSCADTAQQLMLAIKKLYLTYRRVVANHPMRSTSPSLLGEYLAYKDAQIPLAQENDHNLLIDSFPLEVVDELNEKVKLMIARLKEEESSIWYRRFQARWREKKLNLFQHFSLFLEKELEQRIKLSDAYKSILLSEERQLCDWVFSGFSSVLDLPFKQVLSRMTSDVLNYAEAFANRRPFVEDLFPGIVQLFETLHGLISAFGPLLSESIRNEATSITTESPKTVRDFYTYVLDKLLARGQDSFPDGILQMTSLGMDHLCNLFEFRDDSLELVFRRESAFAVGEGLSSSFSDLIASIIELLETRLEAKFETYQNQALRYVFLMNNYRYIERKTHVSGLGAILGDGWVQQRRTKVLQNLEHYKRSSWDEAVGFLKLDSVEETAESMREKLLSFNKGFMEIWKVQRGLLCLVNDEELREEIIKSLKNIFIPAYGNFIEWFNNDLGKGANCIRYSIDEIQKHLESLLDGWDESDGDELDEAKKER